MNIDLVPFETCSNTCCCIPKQTISRADFSYALEAMPPTDKQKYGWMDVLMEGWYMDKVNPVYPCTIFVQTGYDETICCFHEPSVTKKASMQSFWLNRTVAPITAMHAWWMTEAEGLDYSPHCSLYAAWCSEDGLEMIGCMAIHHNYFIFGMQNVWGGILLLPFMYRLVG